MEWFTLLKDEKNNRRLLQIDLDAVLKSNEPLEDVFDKIAFEVRREESSVDW